MNGAVRTEGFLYVVDARHLLGILHVDAYFNKAADITSKVYTVGDQQLGFEGVR